MAKQREATNLAEFVKFTAIGAAVLGYVQRAGENGNGPFVIFSPAGFRPSADSSFTRYEELACGLATDLASKVRRDDVGKILLFVFAGTKPTSKDPLKLFNVVELTTEEARAVMTGGELLPEWVAAPEASITATTGSASTREKLF